MQKYSPKWAVWATAEFFAARIHLLSDAKRITKLWNIGK